MQVLTTKTGNVKGKYGILNIKLNEQITIKKQHSNETMLEWEPQHLVLFFGIIFL